MAETKSTKKDQPMLDPIAYRSNYPEENIIGATPATKEVTEKYVGEGTNNVYHPYNRNLTIDQLDPNYQYGQPAKDINAIDDSYITRRNDMIASALYNEGKVGYNDVVNFLQGQNNWYNSTEEDRATTTANVWNRLGQISADNPKQENNGENADTSRMESDLNKDTSGVIYGKTTADSGNPEKGIQTSSDANSAFKIVDESRIANVKTLLGLSTQQIAAALYSNTIPSDMQAMVDYQSYYPELWAEVQQYLKQYQGQDVVNAIASGTDIPTNTNGTSAANNNIADFAASNSGYSDSMQDILKDIHQTLSSNQSATSASETMADIEGEIATLNNRLKNLTKEANTVFKGDAPDYLVKAYVNNKTQEIQNQLSILSERYKYASNRYDKEVANAQWEKEFQLKRDQLEIQKDELALKDYQIKNGISTTKDNSNSSSATNPGDKFQVTTKSDAEVSEAVDLLYNMFDNGQLGKAQCGVGIQRYYLPMLGISISGISSLEGKKSLINEGEGYIPKRGDLVITNSGAKLEDGTPAGHIGIVLEVHKDGTVEYMDWNGNSDEKPSINGININSKSLLGFRNVNKGQGQNSGGWTDYDYTRFEQYRDATSKSEKETIAAEYGTNVQGMNNIVREALTNRTETTNIPDYSNKEWTNVDYDNFNNFLNSSNKDISNTDRESIAEMYGFKGNLPGMREFARVQLANRPETEETNGSIRFKKYENGFNPSLIQAFEDFGTTKMSDPQYKSMLKTNRLTEEEFGQQRDNYFNYKQTKFDEAGLEILNKIADFQIAMDDMGKIKNGVFNKNWLWNSWFGGGPAKATFDAMTNEQLLNKYVQARSSGVTFGSTTEAEWDIMKATNALEKTTGFLSSDKDFTNAYKSYLHGVWEQTMKKPFSNEEWDSFWMTRKTNRDNMEINSSSSEKNRRKAFDDASDGAGGDDANDWLNG